MIEVPCPYCGMTILVPPTVQGRNGVCFGCGRPLQVPRQAATEKPLSLAFEPGQKVSDRYVILEALGKGGMGAVYKAEDTLVREQVALKFMRPELLNTEKGQLLFIREAQIARRLRHENIVAVHDVSWTQDGILFLSMEFVPGQSLRGFLRQYRTERRLIDVRLCVRFVTQMLRALEFAHRSVVHRDIKPENVMLLPGEQIKVLDFGLAKAMQEEYARADADRSKPRPLIGTLAYAAPEQHCAVDIDARADVYAAGLVFYELLTLRTPLDEQVPVAKARTDVSPSLIEALEKARREDREQRFPNAREFRLAVESAFDSAYRSEVARIEVTARAEAVSTEGMVFQEGGLFLMGNDSQPVEEPEAEVFVEPFWIDRHPVTNAAYAEYLEATGQPEPKFWLDSMCNGPSQPVVGVSWAEAQAYAEWAGKELPDEMQWEFAARGKENRMFPWGLMPPDTTRCNYQDYMGMPSMINMHEGGATPDGVHDLAGNVYEWTRDAFVPYAAQRARGDAAGSAPRKSVRGGCWNSPPDELRCSARKGLFPETREKTLGFRCVLRVKPVSPPPMSAD